MSVHGYILPFLHVKLYTKLVKKKWAQGFILNRRINRKTIVWPAFQGLATVYALLTYCVSFHLFFARLCPKTTHLWSKTARLPTFIMRFQWFYYFYGIFID
jgi:hypothetical protein